MTVQMQNVDPIPDLKKTTFVKVFGSSMEPLIKNGDIIFFKRNKLREIKDNDIIVAKKGPIYLTHRVVYKTNSYVITKGDANKIPDGRIYKKQIVGKIYQIQRKGITYPLNALYVIQNLAYLKTIEYIKANFDQKKIDHLFIKGLPVYLFYTNQMPERKYADCDILVQEKDFERAKKLLLSNGFRVKKKSGFLANFLAPHLMEEDFSKEENHYPVTIDLHKRPFSYIRKLDFPNSLFPKKLIDSFSRDMFSTKRLVTIGSMKIPIPQRDYLLLFLAVHFFTHTMKMSHRLWLIKEIIKKDYQTRPAWNSFIELVSTFKMGFMIYPAFYYINRLYGATIPESVIKRIKPAGNLEKVYGFKSQLVFDERVDFFRILNKFYISWIFSPQPLLRRFTLLISPSLFAVMICNLRLTNALDILVTRIVRRTRRLFSFSSATV